MSQASNELRVAKEKLTMKWDNALRKLTRQINKTETPETLARSKNELAEKWGKLEDCEAEYLAQMTDGAEKEEEKDKFSQLSEKQDDAMNSADEKTKDIKDVKFDVASSDNTEAEATRGVFQTRLGSIVVSKKFQNKFMDDLQKMKVENWCERSQCKVVFGIDPDFYRDQFIGKGEPGEDGKPKPGLFQISSGVDDKTMADFKMVLGAGGMNDQLKSFSSKPEKSGNKITGKFGMYSASKRAGANLIDVAYVVYDFEADLMGDESVKSLQPGATETSQKSLMTRLKVGDVGALSENFILSKALTAFAQSNVIERVNWEEEEGIEGGRLREVETDDDKEIRQNGK